jgi:hypothetical protein
MEHGAKSMEHINQIALLYALCFYDWLNLYNRRLYDIFIVLECLKDLTA